MKFTKLNYCQYLLSSQINYTLTNLAYHLESMSHDQINPYLRREKLTPSLRRENVKLLIQSHENAYIIFDDTVLDKRYSEDIELTRLQFQMKYLIHRWVLIPFIVGAKSALCAHDKHIKI